MASRGHLHGTLQVRFTASSSGRISNVNIHSATLNDPDLILCIRSRLNAVRLGRGPIERYSVPLRLVPTAPE